MISDEKIREIAKGLRELELNYAKNIQQDLSDLIPGAHIKVQITGSVKPLEEYEKNIREQLEEFVGEFKRRRRT